eukprot:RCo034353
MWKQGDFFWGGGSYLLSSFLLLLRAPVCLLFRGAQLEQFLCAPPPENHFGCTCSVHGGLELFGPRPSSCCVLCAALSLSFLLYVDLWVCFTEVEAALSASLGSEQ